jgi:hypothetical protein
MGMAIDKCEACGEYEHTSDAGKCGRCHAAEHGELGSQLYELGVESFDLDREPWGRWVDGEYVIGWGVVDHSTGDIIGSGDSASEALADAIETVRGWEAGK